MDLIDTLVGDGTGMDGSGTTQVSYELQIYQHWLRVGNDPAVPGRREVRGWIRPVFGKADEVLTLELNDESTLRFSFADEDGSIRTDGEIVPLG